ncbi:ATPase [Opitutus sp. ER46]|nr:ATPase [Opitutus sp. ER46]
MNAQPARFPAPGEVRLVRTLPGPIERVWEYLTDPDKRSRWFAGGPMEPRAGGKMELYFRHANLAPDEVPPEGYREHHDPGTRMSGAVLRWEPPHVLSYTFGSSSDVTFELTTQGEDVLLVVTHRSRGEDLASIAEFASGWHIHLDHLWAQLAAAPRPKFWAAFAVLHPFYQQKLGAAAV